MRTKVAIPVIAIIWLAIGLIAAGQRGYYSQSDPDCGSIGSTLLTIVAGPLNYIEGVNPEVTCPEPSR